MKSTFCVAALLTSALLCGCAQSPGGNIVIKASSSSAANEPSVQALEAFGRQVSARTNDRIRVEVYPNNALGNEREVIELTIIGAVEMVCPSSAPLTTFVPELMVFELPYLFRDRAHMYSVLDGPVGRSFEEPLRRRGLRLLGYFEAGLRHLMTKGRRIEQLGDMVGLKVRTMENPLHLRAFEAFGASPLPMAYGEVYSALEQGVIDGAEAANSNYYSKRFFEVAPNWAMIGWMYLVSPLVMSERFYDSLSAADRKVIEAAAETAIVWEREEYQRQEREALQRLEEAGVNITYPDQSAFVSVAHRVWREAQNRVDPVLIEAIVKTGGSNDRRGIH